MQTTQISSGSAFKAMKRPRAPRSVACPARMQPSRPVSMSSTQTSVRAPFFGHEGIARLCARFIAHLFDCPEIHSKQVEYRIRLPHFIAIVIHRAKLHVSVTFTALVLLQRLKTYCPSASRSSGHRLFITTFMIASKVMCDETYSNTSWRAVALGMFPLKDINRMEREMCKFLDWDLVVDNSILSNFEAAVRKDFAEDRRRYPNYPFATVSKRIRVAAASVNSTTDPTPIFEQDRQLPSHTQTPVTQNLPLSSSPVNLPNDTKSPPSSPSTALPPQAPASPKTHPTRTPRADTFPSFSFVDVAPQVHPLGGQMFAYVLPSEW